MTSSRPTWAVKARSDPASHERAVLTCVRTNTDDEALDSFVDAIRLTGAYPHTAIEITFRLHYAPEFVFGWQQRVWDEDGEPSWPAEECVVNLVVPVMEWAGTQARAKMSALGAPPTSIHWVHLADG